MSFTWNQVRDVVDAVLELPAGQRTAYLEKACAEPKLRRYVESLILSYENAGEFLENPAIVSHSGSWDESASWIGRRIGPYRLEAEIGQGGMGSVYRAVRDDEQYEKRVAIKLVKTGYDPNMALARFRAERQILAGLEHPNIARLLDGGTTEEGIPYFVMELVDGEPIDQYCDKNKLSIADRLQLFRTVCSAVQYAHQNLVIHRDLKPGNILVTPDGTPKLLDFGIAKVLTADTAPGGSQPTMAFMRLFTPEFASPEQVRGEPITTASDVYSLGVVLYILLTGHSPYAVDTNSLTEVARVVCEVQPTKPSTIVGRAPSSGAATASAVTPESVSAARGVRPQKLQRSLAGDLDNIALMALRKEPERRYASADQLSEDIRLSLDGRPVRARRDTIGYRLQKFVTRNRVGVAAGVLLLLSLSAGLIVSLHEAHVARLQRERAEKRFQDVRTLANSLMFEIHDGIAPLAGSTPVRKLLVERALTYLDSLSKEAGGDPSLQRELATAYDKIGDVQGMPREANLGDPVGATASYQKALTIRQSLAAADPKDMKVRRDIIMSDIRLTDLLWTRGDNAGALQYSTKELQDAEQVYAAEPSNRENRVWLGACRIDRGEKQALIGGDTAGGLATLRQGAEIFEQLVAENPKDLWSRRRLGLAYSRTAEILKRDSKTFDQAMEMENKTVSTEQALIDADPTNATYKRALAYERYSISQLLSNMGRDNEAIAADKESLAGFRDLERSDPASVQYKLDIALVQGFLGELLTQKGDINGAAIPLEESTRFTASQPDAAEPNSRAGFLLITDQYWMGVLEVRRAHAPGVSAIQRNEHCRIAESWFNKSLPAYRSFGNDARIADIQREMAVCKAPGGRIPVPR
ncbi:MAG TPA: serine/threonine-protein kinase [Candidatus Nitrosotalea sp.]|nr:serine/threonine-protein kinase [Candidatus Nitrosotalea sp.]